MFAAATSLLSIPLLLGSVVIRSYVCQPPVVPVITSPLDGSHLVGGKPVTVRGTSSPETQVILSEKGSTLVSVTADSSSSFMAQLNLSTGTHNITVAASSPCGGEIGDTTAITVTPAPPVPSKPTPPPVYTPTAPIVKIPAPSPAVVESPPVVDDTTDAHLALTITAPGNETTSATSTFVTGTTSQLATEVITLNGKQIATSEVPSMSFGLSVPLMLGVNRITVTATANDLKAEHTILIERVEAPKTLPATTSSTPWYETVPGRVAIGVGSLVIFLIILGLILG